MKIETLIEQLLTHEYIWDESTDGVRDNLAEQLTHSNDNTYYYIGISKFVKDFYKDNSENEI